MAIYYIRQVLTNLRDTQCHKARQLHHKQRSRRSTTSSCLSHWHMSYFLLFWNFLVPIYCSFRAYLFLTFVLVLKPDRIQEVLPGYTHACTQQCQGPSHRWRCCVRSSAILTTPPLSSDVGCSMCCTQLSALSAGLAKIRGSYLRYSVRAHHVLM